MQHERALVVGASSGIGAALAVRLARPGAHVALVARRAARLRAVAEQVTAKGARALVREHDVRSAEEAPALYAEVAAEIGEPDLVVYAAGVLRHPGPDEFTTSADAETVAVNLVGAMAWLNQAALRMSAEGSGTIVGVSSIAGDRGRRGAPAYSASKAGLTTYLESLRNRLHVRGVRVVTVRPGYVVTEMTEGMEMFWEVSADRAAELILAAAERGSVDVHVPARWGLVSWILRLIPSAVMRRLDF